MEVGGFDGEEVQAEEEEGRRTQAVATWNSRIWNGVLCGLVLLGLCAAVLSIARPDLATAEGMRAEWRKWQGSDDGAVVVAGVDRRDPPPKLKRGPKVKYKGHIVAGWFSTGAGDATYNGIYAEDGTYNSQPCYTNGSRWLYYYGVGYWAMAETLGWGPTLQSYLNNSAVVTDPWSTNLGVGTEPPPNLTESHGYPPIVIWTGPYPVYWWYREDAGFVPPAVPIAPCKVSLGGSDLTDYVALAYQDTGQHGFLLASLDGDGEPTGDWFDCVAAADILAEWDAFQSGGLFDDGDGSHAWLCSGAYLNGSDAPEFTWKKFALDPAGGTSTEVSSIAVSLPSIQLSNSVAMGDGTVRFMVKNGTSWTYCEYTPGDAGYTVLGTFPEVPGFPTGFSAVLMGTDDIEDQVLFLNDSGTMYWMRRGMQSGVNQQNIVMACTVTSDAISSDSGAILTVDNVYVTGDETISAICQTYGYYTDFEQIVGDVGIQSYNHIGIRWEPGEAPFCTRPFVEWPVTRRWYVGGDPLLVAGWASDALERRPFVMVARGATITLGLAVATPEAYPLGTVGELQPAEIEPAGTFTFSGNVDLHADAARIYPAGMMTFSGDVKLKCKSVLYPSGQMVFRGNVTLQNTPEEIEEDGPGLYTEAKLTPGVFPGAARRMAVPRGYGRRANRLYGGPLQTPTWQPKWYQGIDTANPLADYEMFWSWCAEDPADEAMLRNASVGDMEGDIRWPMSDIPWATDGLDFYSGGIPTSVFITSCIPGKDDMTLLWDYTCHNEQTLLVYIGFTADSVGSMSAQDTGALSPRRFQLYSADGTEETYDWISGELLRSVGRHRIVLSWDRDGSATLWHNGTMVGYPLDVSSSKDHDIHLNTASLMGSTNPTVTLHETGLIVGYAATAEDVANNPALSRPYGFVSQLG